jgi:hypothetical protein
MFFNQITKGNIACLIEQNESRTWRHHLPIYLIQLLTQNLDRMPYDAIRALAIVLCVLPRFTITQLQDKVCYIGIVLLCL